MPSITWQGKTTQERAHPMSKKHEDILKVKEVLASEALEVATEALGYLRDTLSDCSARDLVNIFNSAVKTHRDIVSDIVSLSDKESKDEASLAKEYTGKVDELLSRLTDGK
jgi:hypothetical protein